MQNYFFYQNDQARINADIVLNDEQQFWKNHSYRRYALMKMARQQNNREGKWNDWQKQYEAWRPPKSLDDWQSNIVPPYTTSVVEAALSEMTAQALIPTVGSRVRKYAPHAQVVDFAVKYSWEVGYGNFELYKAEKQLLIAGTTVWQECYLEDKRKVQMVVNYDRKTGSEKYKEVEIFDFDDVYGEAVNLWDIWFDPYARTVNIGPYKADDAIRRYIFHIDKFRNVFAGTKWDKFGFVNRIKAGGDTNYYQFYQPPKGIDGNEVEVLFHWIRNPDRLIILANDIPFYIGPNPYWHKQLPFGVGQDVVDPWSIYGKGEPGLLESIQDELTTNRRMRLDRQKMDIYKMIFVSNNEALTDQDMIPAPMKPIYVDDVANVKAFEYGDVNPSAYREEQLLKEDAARVTGVDDRQMSVGKAAATATEAAILKDATLKRLKTKIWTLSNSMLLEVAQLRVPNILQYYRTPKIKEIMGNDAIEKMLQIREVAAEQRLITHGGKYYEAEYKTIVTKDKELKRNDVGGVDVIDKRGDNFFMVTPDMLPPSASQLRYKLSAEPQFPLSKPLQQQKIGEFMQHPMVQMALSSGYYDPRKMADELSLINEYDPEKFKAQSTDEAMRQTLIDPKKMLEMASKENELMANGEELVGTPYATPEHTQIHLAFMQSEAFKQRATPEILSIFTKHILLENQAQILRNKQLGNQTGMMNGQQANSTVQDQAIMGGEAKAANPNMQLGPENVPNMNGMMQQFNGGA